jgi:lipoprotein signal peptidase
MIAFIFILAIDQLTKILFPTLVLNTGFFLSSFGELSSINRIGIIAPFYISFLIFMLWCSSEVKSKFPSLSLSIIIFLAGITGNFIDKIYLGGVRDFIPITSLGLAFNLADVAQWVGGGMGIVFLWKYHATLWPDFNARTFQILSVFKQTRSFLGVFISIAIALCGITVFSIAYLSAAFQSQQFNIQQFIAISGVLLLVLFALVSIFLIRYTQRLLGPIKALERWLESGEINESPQPRQQDDFGPYQALAEKIRKKI